MTEHKSYSYRSSPYPGDNESASVDSGRVPPDATNRTSEKQGWDAYRRWLSRVGAKPVRDRSPVDHSLYSWKGYNSWADSVKQNWKPEDSES